MKAAGIEPSALGLSRMYSSVCGHMIIDTKDKKTFHKNTRARNESIRDKDNHEDTRGRRSTSVVYDKTSKDLS